MFKYFFVRNGRQLNRYQCRCTINGSIYSTFHEDFVTQEQSRDVCAAKAIANIKLEEELAQDPIFQGENREIGEKIYAIVSACKTGVFLRKIVKPGIPQS